MSSNNDTVSETISKKQRDPTAPKRNLSAYMYFVQEHRAVVKARHPEMSFADIAKQCGGDWMAMSDAEREKYTALAAADKERYEMELAAHSGGDGGGGGSAAAAVSSVPTTTAPEDD